MRYYITHQKRFDKLVADQLMPPLSRLNATHTPEASSSRSENNLSNKGKNKLTQSSNGNFHKDQNQKSKDAAKEKHESDVHRQTGRKRGRSSSRERSNGVDIPSPPSRSPSPPVRIEKASRGNKYTEEDKNFVVRYIQWKLQDKTESFTKSSICELMSQKVRDISLIMVVNCAHRQIWCFAGPSPFCRLVGIIMGEVGPRGEDLAS